MSAIGERLVALTAALDEAAPLWRPRPFVADPPWTSLHPEVVRWCEGLCVADVIAIEQAERLPDDAPALLSAWQERLAALTTLTVSTSGVGVGVGGGGGVGVGAGAGVGVGVGMGVGAGAGVGVGAGAGVGGGVGARERRVPARKLAQIEAFVSALEAAQVSGVSAVLDWCGGKGHLGRTLGARLGVPVTVLERQADYAADALALAEGAGVTLRFEAADALAAPTGLFGPGVLAVGLHACGELGTRLIEHALHDGVHTLALAPCCLHKVRGLREHGYRPLSALGRAHDPRLDHESLRLATADEVVARASLQASRRRENAWRQGFDLLARAAGRPTYTPLGTINAALALPDFAAFARALAAEHGIALPPAWSAPEAEAAGWRRAERARALGLVRSLFKRTIEVWCALDRAAWLEEHGRTVALVCFSPRALTPRNLLLLATS